MKKKSHAGRHVLFPYCFKWLLMVKLIIFFVIAFTVTVTANESKAQATVSLRFRDVKLKNLLLTIEEQTNVSFIYNDNAIERIRIEEIDVRNKKWVDILLPILEEHAFQADFVGKNSVLIKRKPQNQEKVASGTVRDQDGKPLVGVSIKLKNSDKVTQSNSDGQFSLAVEGVDPVLQFSYVGYLTQEVPYRATMMDVVLVEDLAQLEKVVVVGYGTQKKATLTGSISQVSGDELKKSVAPNLSNSLVGRMPGVIANNRSGEPGNDFSEIYIRGKGSLGNNSPLYVIDGVANRGGIERLNPSDIESITVLKDASAAIYGAQAANGVILVTTKRGNGTKPIITYEGNFGLSENTRTPKLMDSYQYMVYDDEINAHFGRNEKYKDIKNGYKDGTIDPLLYANTDWMNVFFTRSPQTQHSLSLRGGDERIRYYVSGGLLYQKPGFRNTNLDFKTVQFRANLDAKINRDLSLLVEVGTRQENRHNSNYNMGTFFWEAFHAYPFLHDYYPNGLPGPGISWGNNLALLAAGATGYQKIKDNFLNTKVGFNLKAPWIVDGLYFSGYGAFDSQVRNEKRLNDMWDAYRYNPATKEYNNIRETTGEANINLSQRNDDNGTDTWHFKVGYEKIFGPHNINVFAAYEQSKSRGDWFSAYRRDFLSNAVDYMFAGSDNQKNNDGKATISARQNYFGRLSYGFKDRYLMDFTLRRDGSQNFTSDARWGWFPGIAAAWRISQEDFFKENLPAINELKIKASWGKLGNDRVDPFQYLSTFNLGDGALFGVDPKRGKGFTPGRLANPGITWEKVDTKNIGFESVLFNQSLSFDLQYFYSMRTDILTQKQASVPRYTGLTLPDQNIGEISNRGIEASVMYRSKVRDFNYFIGGNFTFVRNKIHFFDEAVSVPDWQRRTGHSIDSWLVYKTDGIYQTKEEVNSGPHLLNTAPGDIKYVDVDGDGNITSNDMVRIYESAIPEIIYGVSMGGKWKNFELNVLWQGQGRAKQMIRPGSYNRDVTYFDNRWISATETPNALYPRAFDRDDTFNTRNSTFWLKDASFIRLKNIELAYNLSPKVLERIKMDNLRIFVGGFNLFSIDHIKVQDPEGTNAGGMYYPQQRIYSVGLNVSF
ncbi:SusC/RagA family TonB-linked outer membrane protein [Sphingobacterium psychroaquaticum]|uniref:TonB-linked outer membrane protein, SusC/RagA family n=1 Tax=Sphingobacterium psychroaquaticum TaxID=561061 RepID=A0A1X7IDR8_9SPHI|nr:TonB-dependent receptor [Sphingobacterium psychroaquaticum]SMG12305.1 TonB-linked outer membrane protein, SusC/RagA family [Sphingobacterium psychroaquaticum]